MATRFFIKNQVEPPFNFQLRPGNPPSANQMHQMPAPVATLRHVDSLDNQRNPSRWARGRAWAWFLAQLGLTLLAILGVRDRRFGFGWLALAAATFVHEFFASVESAKARRVAAFVTEFGFLAVGSALLFASAR